MLQAIEAEISRDGKVTLLEPVHLPQRARAVVTILAPIDETAPTRGSAAALLRVLDSAELVTAEPGDPERMEREIAANRDAWGDCTAFWTNDDRLAKAAPGWSENVLKEVET